MTSHSSATAALSRTKRRKNMADLPELGLDVRYLRTKPDVNWKERTSERACYIKCNGNTEIQHAIRLHIALLAVRGIWSGPHHLTPPK